MTENLSKAQVCIPQASVGQHTQLAAAAATFTVKRSIVITVNFYCN